VVGDAAGFDAGRLAAGEHLGLGRRGEFGGERCLFAFYTKAHLAVFGAMIVTINLVHSGFNPSMLTVA